MYEQLTLDDFQTLQNEMYAIGKQANKFIVAVTGVKSNTDWFNNAYESKGQGSGIIIANSGQELLILTERKVIAEASSVYVTFVNDTSVEASIKKYDGNTGITVLSVPVDEIDNDTMNLISVAVLGNSLAITQGTLALAVGSPLGTNYSILTGNITSSAYPFPQLMRIMIFSQRISWEQKWKWSADQLKRRSDRYCHAGIQQ